MPWTVWCLYMMLGLDHRLSCLRPPEQVIARPPKRPHADKRLEATGLSSPFRPSPYSYSPCSKVGHPL